MPEKRPQNIVIVVQARRGSTRLPDKVMMPVAGKPLLIQMANRILAVKTPHKLVIATTTEKNDDPIEELCTKNGLECFRGDPLDLLDRHYKAGLEYNADVIVKIPSDCPLIDPSIIDKVLEYFLANSDKLDYASNLHPATYPDGNDVEAMHMHVLETAWKEAALPMEREHTTPFVWERPERFRIGNVKCKTGEDLSMSHRFTIDYNEDLVFIKRIYNELYEKDPLFSLNKILKLLEEKPEIMEINKKYIGVNWYRDHLDELKTISKEQTKSI